MIHPGLEALKTWKPIEYVAGYRRVWLRSLIPQNAHHSWECGWEDADTEALELARHDSVLAEGREDDYTNTCGLLFDAGGDARLNGISFDKART